MLKLLVPFFVLSLIISSCKSGSEEVSILQQLENNQKILQNAPKDSINQILMKSQKLQSLIDEVPDKLLADFHYQKGLYHQEMGNKDSAAIYFHNATDYVNDSLTSKAQTKYFQSAWDSYASLGLFADCLSISNKFKSLLDEDKNSRAFTWAFHWEKSAYIMLGKYDKAMDVLDLQMDIAQRKDSSNIPYVKIVQADLLYNYIQDKKSAFKILEDLLSKEDQLTINFQQQVHMNYGIFQYYAGNYIKALSHYKKALNAAKKNTDKSDYLNSLVNDYSNIAEVYIDLKDYSKARIYLDSARNIGIKNMHQDKQKALIDYELRWSIETNQGSAKLNGLINDMYEHQDELYRLKSENELLALTKSNANEKLLLEENQIKEIKNLKLETRLLISIISAGLLAALGFVFFQRRKFNFEKQNLLSQQRLLRSQMNPHFTFNTLSAIHHEIQKDQKTASEYLIKFSRLLRLTLENSTHNFVPIEKEFEALKKYLALELKRNSSSFSYEINFIGMEEDSFLFIPPMLIQPFVENSIEHGFLGINYPGKIRITMAKGPKFIACTIEDNGLGIQQSNSLSKNSKSVQLIADFVKKATKKELRISNKKDTDPNTTGLIIHFLIPFKHTEND